MGFSNGYSEPIQRFVQVDRCDVCTGTFGSHQRGRSALTECDFCASEVCRGCLKRCGDCSKPLCEAHAKQDDDGEYRCPEHCQKPYVSAKQYLRTQRRIAG